MAPSPNNISKALLQSVIGAPPLLDELPESSPFPHHSLTSPPATSSLNLAQKLGHLYEDAMAMLLDHTPQYDILAQSLQIREATGRTIGELDFLLRDLISGQIIHLELAVKFYLAVEKDTELLLPGPDARDDYFRKLAKMRSHQLSLASQYQHLLPSPFHQLDITTQHMVHGCIFTHIQAHKPIKADYLNPISRRGKWLHASQCQDFFPSNTQLEIIPKSLWPVPLEMISDLSLTTWQATKDIDRCLMVRKKDDHCPYFIAPDGYPNNMGGT